MYVSYAVKEVNKQLFVFLFSIYVDCTITIFKVPVSPLVS